MIAGAGASVLLVGGLFAGPGIAFASDADASAQEQAAEALQDEQHVGDQVVDATSQVTSDGSLDDESPDEKNDRGIEIENQDLIPPAEESHRASENEEREAPAVEVAAEEAPSFDDVHIVQERQYQGGAVDVAYRMAVPDSVTEGDTVELTFQAPLDYDDSVPPTLRDSEGEIVATGKLTDPENRVITFTFTDYVDRKNNVMIEGSFAMIANDPELEANLDGSSTTHQITFTQGDEQFEDTLIIDPHTRTPLTRVFNYGLWTGEDRGHEKPENAIEWRANSPEGQWEGMTVSLVPVNATSTFECSTLQFFNVEVPDGSVYHSIENDIIDYYSGGRENNDEQRTFAGTIDELPSFVKSVDCSPEQVEVVYEEHIADNFLRQFSIEASVKDRDQIGHFGSVVRGSAIAVSDGAVECPDPTWNAELGKVDPYVDYASACALQDTHWYNFVARDAAIGGGGGEDRLASIDLIKFSSAEGPQDGDFNTAPGKTMQKGDAEQIVFEITNTGEETLSEIVLEDRTLAGATLEMTACELGGVTLAAGESVTCEGVVTQAEAGQHGNSATVTAVAERSGERVTDTDDWWGSVAADPVKPPVDPKPTDPEPTDPVTPDPEPEHPGLALTGSGVSALLVGGIAALLLLGAGVAYTAARATKRG
ncbi:hypothetical protein GCM10009805_04530 [Leucobacter chromiireducens subsp. solipictus]|uniref:SDR-like Ig domain-containing protein n=2 Tax=Leucobacter TaxID=55968 RepID=A0ABS1SGX3_9MICO|nr:hypothetical protein [Leucobacter chromiireducens subsp. solipictus]